MGKHYNRKFDNKVINILKKNGFECIHMKNKYIIKKDNIETIIHSGMSAFHPLRRYLKITYNFDLDNI
jgi:hypothetical protein